MEKQVEYISFSMNICEQLVKLTPDSEIAYLKSDVAPKDLKAKGINGIDYYIKVLAEKPAEFDPRKYLGPARDEMKKLYMHKILHVLGSNGKLAK